MNPLQVALALIEREGRWFLQRRDPAALVLPGLWEFPGGKCEPGEAPEAAVRRELQEELAWEPGFLTPFPPVHLEEGGLERVFHSFSCSGEGLEGATLAWGWFTPRESRCLPMPPMNQRLLSALLAWNGKPFPECP